MCGFEQGSIGVFTATTGGPTISTTQKRTGAYAFYCANYQTNGSWTLPSDLTEFYIRVALYPEAYGTPPIGVGYSTLLLFRNSDGENMLLLYLNAAGLLGTAYWSGGGWVALSTGTIPLPLRMWSCIEVHIHLDNAGDFDTRVNGVADITFPGDTLGDQTPASIRQVWLNGQNNIGVYGMYYDDFALNDTAGAVNNSWVGRGGIVALVPTADSAVSDQWTANTGNKWDAVNDATPDDATTYVYESVADEIQLSTLSDNSMAGTPDAICVWARAALSAAGTGSIALDIYTSAGHAVSGDFALDTSYVYKNYIWETDTVGAHAWDDAHLDALEAGVKVR
jgi:hypothetical protein